MKCEQAQERVNAYIDRTMPDRELEDFIAHVKSCPDCFDELETYYIVNMTMKYLEDGKEESYDIAKQLRDDLNGQRQRIRRKRRLIVVLLLAAAVLAAGIIMGSFIW